MEQPVNNSISKTTSRLAFLRKWRVDSREATSEWFRIYFHTIFVTLLMVFNLILGYSGLIIYLSRWKHSYGSVDAVLSYIFPHPPLWLDYVLGAFYIPFDTWHWGWMFLVFNLPLFNWLYSTITQPIKKGFKTIISWRSVKGRYAILILSAIPFMFIYLALMSVYVDTQLFSFFSSIQSNQSYLIVNSMASFGYILMALPALLLVYGTFMVTKQFYVDPDLNEIFESWEFPLFARASFSLKGDRADVVVGWEEKTNKPVVVNEGSRYLHELVDGATGVGKTSTTILIRIAQDLIRIARGKKMGVVVLEPKGDLVEDVIKIAKKLGIPDNKIRVIDPTDKVRSIKFNPFSGPMEAAAESFRGTLDSLSADQDEFFKGQQGETASLYTMLGKLRYRNLFNINHMQRMYTDPRFLANMTEEVRREIRKLSRDENLSSEQKKIIERYERVVSYFEDEVLEYKTYKNKEQETKPVTYPEGHRYAGLQVVENKKDKFVTGAKKYLNDIAMNAMLSDLMVATDDDVILNIDDFLAEGGVLLINSALGELEELSLLLGQFFIRQFQSAVFRRPKDDEPYLKTNEEGNEIEVPYKRIPIFFNIDEFPLYANESFERMLTLGRSYRVGSLIAIQNIGQLKKVYPGYEKIILGNSRNKTVFGGGEFDDNEYFSKQFGESYQIEESLNESSTPWTMPDQRWDHRYNTQRMLMARFSPTEIMELKFKHFIVQRVDEENNLVPPVHAIGKFIDETKLIKKFINIGEIELQTKKGKPLDISGQISEYKALISSVLKKGKEQTETSDSNPIAGNVEGTIPNPTDDQTNQVEQSSGTEKVIDFNKRKSEILTSKEVEKESIPPRIVIPEDIDVPTLPEEKNDETMPDSKPVAGDTSTERTEPFDERSSSNVSGIPKDLFDLADDDLLEELPSLSPSQSDQSLIIDEPITYQQSIPGEEMDKNIDELINKVGSFSLNVKEEKSNSEKESETLVEPVTDDNTNDSWSLDDIVNQDDKPNDESNHESDSFPKEEEVNLSKKASAPNLMTIDNEVEDDI